MNSSVLPMLLSTLATQIPVILASIAGLIVVFTRWQRLSRAAPWALAGFGLSLALCVLMPVAQALAQGWVMERGAADAAWIFAVIGIVWSLLHALTLIALVVAVCAGRGPAGAPATTVSAPPLPGRA